MKKQRKFQRLKNYIYSGRFRTRLILLLVVLPGFIFTTKAIKADGIELLPEGELMERLESLEEDPAILSEKKAVLTLDGLFPMMKTTTSGMWRRIRKLAHGRAYRDLAGGIPDFIFSMTAI